MCYSVVVVYRGGGGSEKKRGEEGAEGVEGGRSGRVEEGAKRRSEEARAKGSMEGSRNREGSDRKHKSC